MLIRDRFHDLSRSAASQIMKVSHQVHLVVVADFMSDVDPAHMAGPVLRDGALKASDPGQCLR